MSAPKPNAPKKRLAIGMLGFGTVGMGVAKIIHESQPPLKDKTGIDIHFKRIAVRDLNKQRAVSVDKDLITDDAQSIVQDPDVNIVVEVMGGIEPARTLILEALKNGKAVVTANKALMATHGKELFEAALAGHSSIGFEASVCAGVPVIGAIRDGLVANRVETIHGILNGTTNYILMRMVEEKAPYAQALKEAQEKGYAEADPTMDVDGTDAAHKIVLLADLAFHSTFNFDEVHVSGIENIADEDVVYAAEMGYCLKLLAIAKRRTPGADPEDYPGGLELRVHPALLPFNHPLANVRGVNNAVLVRGDATGEVMLYGRGAGMLPTASAIVADVMDAARGSAQQTFTKLQFFQNPRADLTVIPQGKIRSRYYVRFTVEDRPGAMGKVATVLGEFGLSIASVIQKERHASGLTHIVMLTHLAIEERFQEALAAIEQLSFIRKPSAFYRVED